MVSKTEYRAIEPYTTKDGSVIRELMHPDIHGNVSQSLAEATVPVGMTTLCHRHIRSEELYHILEGSGLMRLGDGQTEVGPGDTVCIPPGTPHQIENTGTVPLRLLCCCSPPYSHDDTELSEARCG